MAEGYKIKSTRRWVQCPKKKSNDVLGTEVLALKRQFDTIEQQLVALTIEMHKRNQNNSHGESTSDVQPREGPVTPQHMGEIQARIVKLDFLVFHGKDLTGSIYKVHHFFYFS